MTKRAEAAGGVTNYDPADDSVTVSVDLEAGTVTESRPAAS